MHSSDKLRENDKQVAYRLIAGRAVVRLAHQASGADNRCTSHDEPLYRMERNAVLLRALCVVARAYHSQPVVQEELALEEQP